MPQKQKIAIEEKIRIVRDVIARRISASEAADAVQAGRTTIDDWIRIYESE